MNRVHYFTRVHILTHFVTHFVTHFGSAQMPSQQLPSQQLPSQELPFEKRPSARVLQLLRIGDLKPEAVFCASCRDRNDERGVSCFCAMAASDRIRPIAAKDASNGQCAWAAFVTRHITDGQARWHARPYAQSGLSFWVSILI